MSAEHPIEPTASHAADQRFVGHARTVMAITLVSRISGLAREAVCSRVFGVSPIWSAFATAFIVPNLFRRLFGEGALSAAFLPMYAQLVRENPRVARSFASLTVIAAAAVLGIIALAIEFGLLAVLPLARDSPRSVQVIHLTMIMLPFAPAVCLGAIFGGMLQTHGRFAPHAAAPVILNLTMGATAGLAAFALDLPLDQIAIAVAASVVVAGVFQIAWFLLALRSLRPWTRVLAPAGGEFRVMLRRLAPAIVGMGALQLGTAIDGLLAGWPVMFGTTLPGGATYPMDDGAASVLFFSARLYQFPLGVFGIAIATAVFPALARHHDRTSAFADILERGLRTSFFISLPATIGLLLVAEPLARTVYGGGAFGDADAIRVTAALRAYTPAIWAYALTHVLTRAFYAVGETRLPMRVGIATVILNILLNVILMWPLAEQGLALGTSLAAIAQTVVLLVLARRRLTRRPWSGPLRGSIGLTVLGSAGLGAVLVGVHALAPGSDEPSWASSVWVLCRDVGLGAGVYLGLAAMLRRQELRWLMTRESDDGEPRSG